MIRLSDHRVRSAVLAVSLWLFGLFTTLVLVGVWGRAVTADRPTLIDSARLLLASDVVNDRLEAWLTDGLAVSSSVAPARIADVVAMVAESNEADAAIAIAADEAVTSALSPPGTARALDLRPAALELAPAVSRALAEAGIDVAPGAVSAAMDNADLSLSSAPGSWVSGAAHRGTAALTRVLVVGLVGMIGTGAISVWASDDRVLRIRTLASRRPLVGQGGAVVRHLRHHAPPGFVGRRPIGRSIIGRRGSLHSHRFERARADAGGRRGGGSGAARPMVATPRHGEWGSGWSARQRLVHERPRRTEKPE
jgi:hypothetical protein